MSQCCAIFAIVAVMETRSIIISSQAAQSGWWSFVNCGLRWLVGLVGSLSLSVRRGKCNCNWRLSEKPFGNAQRWDHCESETVKGDSQSVHRACLLNSASFAIQISAMVKIDLSEITFHPRERFVCFGVVSLRGTFAASKRKEKAAINSRRKPKLVLPSVGNSHSMPLDDEKVKRPEKTYRNQTKGAECLVRQLQICIIKMPIACKSYPTNWLLMTKKTDSATVMLAQNQSPRARKNSYVAHWCIILRPMISLDVFWLTFTSPRPTSLWRK